MDASPRSHHPPTWDRLVVAILLVAAVAPFARTVMFGYVMDDTMVIRSNPDLAGWGSLWRVWTHGYGGEDSSYLGLYRPLTMTVFAFVWNAGGHWPLWFHAVAIAMHAGATILVWRVARLGVSRGPAALAALWFAVHPVHVEAVANVANSSEVMVAIWTCLLTLQLAHGSRTAAPISWAAAAVAGALYLAAFLSKESGAVAPILAALWVWGCRRDEMSTDRGPAWIARRWRPVLVAWAVVAVVVVLVRSAVLGGPITGQTIAAPGIDELSAAGRLRAMLSLGPVLLGLLTWPRQINPHYGPTTFPTAGATSIALLTLVALAAVLGIAARLAVRGDRRFLAATLWVLVAFLPASNLLVPTGQLLAERTLYVPSIGVVLLVASGLDALWVKAHGAAGWRAARVIAVAILGVVIGASWSRTARWTEVWRSHDALFSQMITADTAGYRGYWLSGLEARRLGESENALLLLARAHGLYPRDKGLVIDYAQTLLTVGRAREARGDTATAAALYREGVRIAPRDTALQTRLRALRAAP
ncbi:MAG: hypothetical protein ACRENU_10805 [Gemmatimonadaceae bacterium]